MARQVYCQRHWLLELTLYCNVATIGLKLIDLVMSSVGNENVLPKVDGHARRIVEFNLVAILIHVGDEFRSADGMAGFIDGVLPNLLRSGIDYPDIPKHIGEHTARIFEISVEVAL